MNSRKSSASSITNASKPASSKSIASSASIKTSVQSSKKNDDINNKQFKAEENIKLEDESTKARYNLMMSKLSETSLKDVPNEAFKTTIKETSQELSSKINPAQDLDKQNNQSSDEEDEDDASSRRRAPNELLEEFLVYVMQKNWKDAHKLCKFILMYEPNNATAKEFLPLIEQKLELNESDTSGEETDDDDDDDDSDEDSDSDDSDDDSDSTSDESDEEEKKKPQLNKNDIKSIKTNNKLNGNHNHK